MPDSKLTKQQVKQIAALANLELTDDEVATYQTQLSAIIDYFQQLQTIDTQNLPVTAQITGLHNVWRQTDQIGDRTLPPQKAVEQSQHRYKNYIAVDMILKHR